MAHLSLDCSFHCRHVPWNSHCSFHRVFPGGGSLWEPRWPLPLLFGHPKGAPVGTRLAHHGSNVRITAWRGRRAPTRGGRGGTCDRYSARSTGVLVNSSACKEKKHNAGQLRKANMAKTLSRDAP